METLGITGLRARIHGRAFNPRRYFHHQALDLEMETEGGPLWFLCIFHPLGHPGAEEFGTLDAYRLEVVGTLAGFALSEMRKPIRMTDCRLVRRSFVRE